MRLTYSVSASRREVFSTPCVVTVSNNREYSANWTKKSVDPDSQRIGIAVIAAPPAVMGNDLSAERRGLSDKMMSL